MQFSQVLPPAPRDVIEQESNHNSLGTEQGSQSKETSAQAQSSDLQSIATQQAQTLQQTYLSVANGPKQGSAKSPLTVEDPSLTNAFAGHQSMASQQAKSLHQGDDSASNSASMPESSSSKYDMPKSAKAESEGAAVNQSIPTSGGHTTADYALLLANDQQANAASLASSSTAGNTPNVSAPLAFKHTPANELRDFLSGFDKVNGQAPQAIPPAQHSPPFTSQSFDDFHRLLGKGLSPSTSGIDEGLSRFSIPGQDELTSDQQRSLAQPTLNASPQNHKADATALNSNKNMLSQAYKEALSTVSKEQGSGHLGADSYNIFAQESAFAASQHSAYRNNNQSYAPPQRQPGRNQTYPSSQEQEGHCKTLTASHEQPGRSHSHAPSQEGVSHLGLITTIRQNSNVVSEPSNASDQGDESPGESFGSGNEGLTVSDNTSNDSDGTHSDTGSSSRKKARISYSKSPRKGHRPLNFANV